MRHCPSIGLGLGLSLRSQGRGLDPAVSAFAAESGATDLTGLDNLVKYLKGESLYNNFVIYPMKSAQNAGSGATVYSLGGLTTNNMTLVSGPTWGASGIAFDAVADYGHVSDFIGAETITSFTRRSGTVGGANTFMVGQYDFSANERSWSVASRVSEATSVSINRSSDGSLTNFEAYSSATSGITTADTCYVATWIAGAGRELAINTTSTDLTRTSGTAQTVRLNSADAITINAVGVVGAVSAFMGGTYLAQAICNTAITSTQRDAITNLINAL